MANNYKVVGQAAPLADTETDLYIVPASTSFIASLLKVTNRDSSPVPAFIKVAVVPSGGTLGDEHYIEFNKAVDGSASISVQGLVLATGDKLVVIASTANVSFSLFGVELS